MMSLLVLLAACVYGYGGMWGMTLEEERKALLPRRIFPVRAKRSSYQAFLTSDEQALLLDEALK